MRADEAVNRAYSVLYRGIDTRSIPQRGGRHDSTGAGCVQAMDNLIYRAVEGAPPHESALVRICFTDSGSELDELEVFRFALQRWSEIEGRAGVRPGTAAAIMLLVKNFPNVVQGRDKYGRKEFAGAAGVTVDHYTKTLLPVQRHVEDILATALAKALEPVRAIIKQQR